MATNTRVASIRCANIVVVAIFINDALAALAVGGVAEQSFATSDRYTAAGSRVALIRLGAEIAVVASICVVRVIASPIDTGIVGAVVAVVAVGRRAAHAGAARTSVAGRASVAVVTEFNVVRVETTCHLVAGIVRADVAVAAIQRLASEAESTEANVVDRA